jgi:hypothetical protein
MIMGGLPKRVEAVTSTGMSGRKGTIFNARDQRDLLQVDISWRRRRKERDGRQLGGASGAWCYQDMCA